LTYNLYLNLSKFFTIEILTSANSHREAVFVLFVVVFLDCRTLTAWATKEFIEGFDTMGETIHGW